MTDPAIDAFLAAHGDLRIRGAFRLLGVVLTVGLVMPLTVDSPHVFHEGVYLIYPGPFTACWLLGELVVACRRALRRSVPRIPMARAIRRSSVRSPDSCASRAAPASRSREARVALLAERREVAHQRALHTGVVGDALAPTAVTAL